MFGFLIACLFVCVFVLVWLFSCLFVCLSAFLRPQNLLLSAFVATLESNINFLRASTLTHRDPRQHKSFHISALGQIRISSFLIQIPSTKSEDASQELQHVCIPNTNCVQQHMHVHISDPEYLKTTCGCLRYLTPMSPPPSPSKKLRFSTSLQKPFKRSELRLLELRGFERRRTSIFSFESNANR